MHTLISTSLRFGFVLAGIASMPFAASAQSVSLAAAARPQAAYTLVDLGNVQNNWKSYGYGVNDSGQVTGLVVTLPSSGILVAHAFVTDPNGSSRRYLGTGPDGFPGTGRAINSSGQVAGDDYQHAFLSDPNGGTLHFLGTLPGGGRVIAGGLNASGQVTGSATTAGSTHAYLTDASGGTLHDLGTLSGDAVSEGFGVNASGQVAGHSYKNGSNGHAFLSGPNGGALHDLGSLGGSGASAYGVNASGQVTGFGVTAGSAADHAFLSDPNGGKLHDLGGLPGKQNSIGFSVNDSGQVVGQSDDGSDRRAFVFSNGVMTDLNTLIAPNTDLGLIMTSAYSISDTGYITGEAYKGSNETIHAFLLIPINAPVPEASSVISFGLLLALGLGVFAVTRRKSAKVSA